jgi:hypothetical protein
MKRRDWIKYQGVWVRWHEQSPANRRSKCEGRKHLGSRWVEKDEPRLEVDNDQGSVRVNSHGKRNQWVCQVCAIDVPHKPDPDNQIGWDLG